MEEEIVESFRHAISLRQRVDFRVLRFGGVVTGLTISVSAAEWSFQIYPHRRKLRHKGLKFVFNLLLSLSLAHRGLCLLQLTKGSLGNPPIFSATQK